MEEPWWEAPTCWFCDYWWALLAAVILALTAYFSRDIWLPQPSSSPTPVVGLTNVTVSQREVELVLCDNGDQIDGDRIRLTVNGKVILEDHTLIGEGTTVPISLDEGANQIVILALNEGDVSPNTVEVTTSHVVEGPPVQISNRLLTGQSDGFTVYAP